MTATRTTLAAQLAAELARMPAMRIAIKHRFSAAVLFAHEVEGNTLRITLEAAVKARANLSGAYLSGSDLSGADLSGFDLSGADLSGSDLSGADLSGSDLSGSDLSVAYLSRADLSGSDLSGSDLSGADLSGSDLSGADLSVAYLVGANLSGADQVIDAGTPNGWRTIGWLRDGYLSVLVGCRDKRLAEGREYWAGRDNRREVLAALDYVEAIAKLRGWATE